jgi:hypothetical protein
MQLLEDHIRREGKVAPGNVLRVDGFLNHQMDIELFDKMGEEFKRRFANENINKIVTIEASGIGIACIVAKYFDAPVVFAKKSKSISAPRPTRLLRPKKDRYCGKYRWKVRRQLLLSVVNTSMTKCSVIFPLHGENTKR